MASLPSFAEKFTAVVLFLEAIWIVGGSFVATIAAWGSQRFEGQPMDIGFALIPVIGGVAALILLVAGLRLWQSSVSGDLLDWFAPVAAGVLNIALGLGGGYLFGSSVGDVALLIGFGVSGAVIASGCFIFAYRAFKQITP